MPYGNGLLNQDTALSASVSSTDPISHGSNGVRDEVVDFSVFASPDLSTGGVYDAPSCLHQNRKIIHDDNDFDLMNESVVPDDLTVDHVVPGILKGLSCIND